MQFLIERLDRPWGFSLQIGLLAGWLKGDDGEVSVRTRNYDETVFPSLDDIVSVEGSDQDSFTSTDPTLVGPFPSTSRANQLDLESYSVLLPYIPWNLYPSKRKRWLGQISAYGTGGAWSFVKSMGRLMSSPIRKADRAWKRRQDQHAIEDADSVYIYDDRLRKPVKDVYDREPELISPVAAVGQGKSSDPDNRIVATGPYEPLHNFKRLIDAFYLFVNRLGTRRRDDWDGRNPMQMWQAGDFTLCLHGVGNGKEYLDDYAESQQLGEQVEFADWIPPEDLDAELGSALAVVDVPLAGDASAAAYQAMSLGVPAVHTRHHRGLDTFLRDSHLSHGTKSTDIDHIAKSLLEAVKTPTSERQPIDGLKKALNVESGVRHFQEQFNS